MARPWMPLYVGDYLADTAHLRAAEHGAYLLLIMHYWRSEGLPKDDDSLARIARITNREWAKMRPTIAALFGDDWKHKRIEFELTEAARISAAGKKGGRASGEARRKSSNENRTTDERSFNDQGNDLATNREALQSQLPRDRIGSAGASHFTEGSKALTVAFWKALGFGSPLQVPPEFAGVDWRALEWERAGWTIDLIDAEARRVGPDKPLTYYEKVFATSFAKRQAPLPVVEIREAEKLTVTHGKPKSAIIQAADDLCRKLASFDGPSGGADELRGNAGEDSPRLLSNG